VNLPNFFSELKRRNVYKVAIAYGVVAWLLMQIATLHYSLKSPLCSWVSITLPKKQLKLPGDHQAVRDSRQLK
jgi:hypothetical protein